MQSKGDAATGSPRLLSRWLRQWWVWLFAFALMDVAFLRASSLIWIADDAYASFRYADNWAHGLGLVFNPHERVEGITNPLWTLALGLLDRWGFDVERSSTTIGVLAYLSCVPLLIVACRVTGMRRILPVAAVIAIADPDLATFASGGLETQAFTVSVLASYAFAFAGSAVQSGLVTGFFAAISGMLRPDGVVFVPALMLAFIGKSRRRGLIPYLLLSFLALAAFHGWRRLYYGSWLPNTYYAKSAFLSWWSQGAIYLGYFAQRHASVLTAGVALSTITIVIAIRHARRTPRSSFQTRQPERIHHLLSQLGVAWAMIVVYTLIVVRVGGDFMYARLLVPIIPLLAIAVQLPLDYLLHDKRALHASAGVTVAGLLFVAPCPVDTDIVSHHGIVDERAYYQGGLVDLIERNASNLRECLSGYPFRAAIYGGELRLAYRARYPYAIEAHAGLTDWTIAHQPLSTRRRVGHEKSADAAYLVLTQRAHFATSPLYAQLSDPNGFIPEVYANLCGTEARLLHWDPAFNEFARARGAVVPDYPAWLDQILARVNSMPDSWVKRQWDLARHFYFEHVSDPARASVFETRLHRSNYSP